MTRFLPHRRLGNDAGLGSSAALGLLLTGISTTVVVTTYGDWSDHATDVADQAVGHALDLVATPPLSAVEAYASTDHARLTHLLLVARACEGCTADLGDTRVLVRTPDDLYRYDGTPADGRLVTAQPLRDPNVSLVTQNVIDGGDVVQFDLDLSPLDHPIRAGDAFDVSIQSGSAPPLEMHVVVPGGGLPSWLRLSMAA